MMGVKCLDQMCRNSCWQISEAQQLEQCYFPSSYGFCNVTLCPFFKLSEQSIWVPSTTRLIVFFSLLQQGLLKKYIFVYTYHFLLYFVHVAIKCLELPLYVTLCLMSSAYCILMQSAAGSGRSAIYMIYNVGDIELLCGTPAARGKSGHRA